ncbi:MarR family winged helix-turn-helix transcriptional regulator [Peristeroidobacter soli]|uniref:MarR family winged helix-turn-helix transcriptional regulator n=1 Tax=Peristeroidobacter soli TaxID=2497877 RepID=UPI00101C42DE|nr:MarR family transcriptional regulator [Peristeroidobacter soli]
MVSNDTFWNSRVANPLESHIGYWLRMVSNQVSGSFARALQERQISVAEWVALNQIGNTPDPTPARLADSMGMTRGAVSKVLDKLDAKNWIARTTSDQDSRVQFLSLTAAGRRLLPQLTAIADGNDERFFNALTKSEQATLRGLLRKLADAHHITQTPVE